MEKTTRKPTNVFSILLFIFSGITLVLSMISLISALSSSGAIESQVGLIMGMVGLGQLAGLVINPLRSLVVTIGGAAALMLFVLSALLFTAGLLLNRNRTLADRVTRLEEELELLKNK